ncbi:MAG: C1 family peptidase [Pseudomonadota bacterium]|nr:C1 family peptidase [Pseudomonadota bacterium]
MKKLIITSLALSSALSFAATNPNVMHVPIPLPPLANLKTRSAAVQTVSVLPVKLSPAFLELQRTRSVQPNSMMTRATGTRNALPTRINLTMNKVPILNQGEYGTCVIFAFTAAIDAALGKGDYVSQVCLLQLSSHLADYSYWGNAWDGSLSHWTIAQIRQYGIISKADEKNGVCNDMRDYPLHYNESHLQQKMSLIDYHKYSQNVLSYNSRGGVAIEPQLLFKFANYYDYDKFDKYITLSNNTDGWVTPEESLTAVRKALAEGNRVVLGVLLHADYMWSGRNKVLHDTWFADKALKQAFKNQNNSANEAIWGYHEVVLYGYDDTVTVTNAKGEKQKGVFLVRNSWGTITPCKGVEFMTYDYFKLMADDAYSMYTSK